MRTDNPLSCRFAPALLMGLLGSCAWVNADVSYQYTAVLSVFSAAPNTPVSVSVYLTEMVTGNSSSLLGSEGGLYSAGTTLGQTLVSGTPSLITAIYGNTAGFTGNVSANLLGGGTSAAVDENIGTSFTGVTASDLGGGVSRVFLGTATITTGAAAGITTFSVGQLGSGTQGTTMTNTMGYTLDTAGSDYFPAVGSTFSITTAVPEPASLGLMSLATVFIAVRRRRSV